MFHPLHRRLPLSSAGCIALTLIVIQTLFGSLDSRADQLTVAVPEITWRENLYDSPRPFAFLLRSSVFETLLKESTHGGWSLGIASAAQSSADGMSWQFSLRTGRRFSSHAPVSTADVVSSLEFCKSRGAHDFEVSAIREGTVSVRRGKEMSADALLSVFCSCPIVEKRSREIFGSHFGSGTHFVGSGPYRIVEFQEQQRIFLERREGPPGAQRIEIKSYPEPTQALTSLRLGGLDISFSVSDEVLERARKDETLQVAECSIFYVVFRQGLSLNCGQAIDIANVAYQSQSPRGS